MQSLSNDLVLRQQSAKVTPTSPVHEPDISPLARSHLMNSSLVTEERTKSFDNHVQLSTTQSQNAEQYITSLDHYSSGRHIMSANSIDNRRSFDKAGNVPDGVASSGDGILHSGNLNRHMKPHVPSVSGDAPRLTVPVIKSHLKEQPENHETQDGEITNFKTNIELQPTDVENQRLTNGQRSGKLLSVDERDEVDAEAAQNLLTLAFPR